MVSSQIQPALSLHAGPITMSHCLLCCCSIPGVGVLLQSASLLGGIVGDIIMRAAALLPPADVAIKDFSLSYPVSSISIPWCVAVARWQTLLLAAAASLTLWTEDCRNKHSVNTHRSAASGHAS